MINEFDAIVLGGGAAGLMCALTAGARGKRVLIIEKSNKLGKKILMSGGGRCNFTNLEVTSDHFLCSNPHFVKSALAQYSQWDFIALVEKHGIAYHEKKHGQLFCDDSAKGILNMLIEECELGGVKKMTKCEVSQINYDSEYKIETNQGSFTSQSLVIATGGLSIPTLGGSGFAYQYAKERGLNVIKTEASLAPFTLTGQWHDIAQSLSGVALPVVASVPSKAFTEDMLFTHRGLSGPAILQLSNYWQTGEPIEIDLLPQVELAKDLIAVKRDKPSLKLSAYLNEHLPKSVVQNFLEAYWSKQQDLPLQEISDAALNDIGKNINHWQLTPSGTEGYRTAEVTRGGIDVNVVSSQTMRVNLDNENLFIIGEALDVTGHLGGYNFQWAWSSGFVAGDCV